VGIVTWRYIGMELKAPHIIKGSASPPSSPQPPYPLTSYSVEIRCKATRLCRYISVYPVSSRCVARQLCLFPLDLSEQTATVSCCSISCIRGLFYLLERRQSAHQHRFVCNSEEKWTQFSIPWLVTLLAEGYFGITNALFTCIYSFKDAISICHVAFGSSEVVKNKLERMAKEAIVT
jgi:hypothetical protein